MQAQIFLWLAHVFNKYFAHFHKAWACQRATHFTPRSPLGLTFPTTQASKFGMEQTYNGFILDQPTRL